MRERAIVDCPDSLWLSSDYPKRFWHIAYHAVFYAHLYLHANLEEFRPWPKHRQNCQYLGALPWPPQERLGIDTPYGKADVIEFLEFCRGEAAAKLPSIDLAAPSGFHWRSFTRLEVQIYSIRHLQHHVGQLGDRLRTANGTGTEWVIGS